MQQPTPDVILESLRPLAALILESETARDWFAGHLAEVAGTFTYTLQMQEVYLDTFERFATATGQPDLIQEAADYRRDHNEHHGKAVSA
ncbi:MAG: hypothetical protein AMXMBFR7_26670 [Planctomycetota bacterium]